MAQHAQHKAVAEARAQGAQAAEQQLLPQIAEVKRDCLWNNRAHLYKDSNADGTVVKGKDSTMSTHCRSKRAVGMGWALADVGSLRNEGSHHLPTFSPPFSQMREEQGF